MKDRYFLALGVLVLSLFLFGCATTVELPSNAQTIQGSNGGEYLSRVDFSYTANKPHDFSQFRLCVAQNVSNNSVTLHDVSGSWVGPYTGTYYQQHNHQQVAGTANIFKLVDEKTSTLIAVGTTMTSDSNMFIPMTSIVKYEVMVGVQGNGIKLMFSNITRAWQTTGAATNDGFQPVGIWQGTHADSVYRSLEVIAGRIRACAP